ncbi:hypothetical protein [Yinghuangia sp. YIM S09857]|uniref:hypothetical protein n=1 Tax=Yinghuangia sp. YIM S09857 TaxID=3436929 RepID=UPI003F52B917
MEIEAALHRVREFHWGCIHVNDNDEGDFDPDSMQGPGPVWPSRCWVSIRVRHAQLGDADVELVVDVRREAVENADYATVIDVPSGVLSVGDADDRDHIRLAPGRWLLQVDLDSPKAAVQVRITLSPVLEVVCAGQPAAR